MPSTKSNHSLQMVGTSICTLESRPTSLSMHGTTLLEVRFRIKLVVDSANYLEVRSFRVHPKEAERLNFTDSILIDDGDDFSSMLGVMHNLHCLVRPKALYLILIS